MRGVRKNRYREATRALQSGVPDNLRGCWSRLYPKASRSKYQSINKDTRISMKARLGATRRWGRSGDPRPQLLLLRSPPSRSAGTEHARDLHMRWDIFGQWRQQSGRDTTPHRRYCCREL